MATPTTSGDIEVVAQVLYDPATDKAYVENTQAKLLTPAQQAAYRARELVRAAMPKQQLLCGTYNLEVMPASVAKRGKHGWLVYALVAMPAAGVYPVGGFHEFLVSPNGTNIVEHRALSKGCLNLDPAAQQLPQGAKLTAFTVTDLISDAPLPPHVFVSLQSRIPVFVFTIQNDRTWKSTGDQIQLIDN